MGRYGVYSGSRLDEYMVAELSRSKVLDFREQDDAGNQRKLLKEEAHPKEKGNGENSMYLTPNENCYRACGMEDRKRMVTSIDVHFLLKFGLRRSQSMQTFKSKLI